MTKETFDKFNKIESVVATDKLSSFEKISDRVVKVRIDGVDYYFNSNTDIIINRID